MPLKILHVLPNIGSPPYTGREILAFTISKAFDSLDSCHVTHIALPPPKTASILKRITNSWQGYSEGVTRDFCQNVVSQISANEPDFIFIGGSTYWKVAKTIKAWFPKIPIVCLFHNIEAKFFWDAFLMHPSLRRLAVFLFNLLAEIRMSAYVDIGAFLTERDRLLAKKVYRLKNTSIFPLCLPSRTHSIFSEDQNNPISKRGLFVGGSFYANVAGVKWFISNVAPFVSCSFDIVGKGLQEALTNIVLPANISLIGEVEDLSLYYERCTFVIAPIFHGSGMKTKVAEALMYGKPTIGTSMAFEGYNKHAPHVGITCSTADDFIAAISNVVDGSLSFDSHMLGSIYDQYFSLDACKYNLNRVIQCALQLKA